LLWEQKIAGSNPAEQTITYWPISIIEIHLFLRQKSTGQNRDGLPNSPRLTAGQMTLDHRIEVRILGGVPVSSYKRRIKMQFNPSFTDVWHQGMTKWDRFAFVFVLAVAIFNIVVGSITVGVWMLIANLWFVLYAEANLRAKVYKQLTELDFKELGLEIDRLKIEKTKDD
jgi:hypothetical protein